MKPRSQRVYVVLLTALLLCVIAGVIRASGPVMNQVKLTVSGGAANNRFGAAVAIRDNFALIIAEYSGSKAYIFQRNGSDWQKLEELPSYYNEIAWTYSYNHAAIWTNIAVAGAQEDHDKADHAGAAFVYNLDATGTNWVLQQKIYASDIAGWRYFGASVAVDSNYIVAGAVRADGEDGAAYIFKRDGTGTNWVQEQMITASDGGDADIFGHAVSISGTNIAVGARDQSNGGQWKSGGAYVYGLDSTGTNWVQHQKLTASDIQYMGKFGASVSIDSDTLAVGSPCYDATWRQNDKGRVYMFKRDASGTNWIQKQKIVPADGAVADNFGFSVAVSDGTLLVGSYGYDNGTLTNAGAVYIYKADSSGTNWVYEQKLLASDGNTNDSMGCSIGISGDTCIAGSHLNDTVAADAGAAYVFYPASGDTGTIVVFE